MTTSPMRSSIMRAVRSVGTRPELLVRKLARAIRPGYRLNRRDIPGAPDLAWIGAKRALFVHGCFWHGHDCTRGARTPKTNRAYWEAKIARNRARDEKALAMLDREGWTSLVLWECELKDEAGVRERLRAFLNCPS